MSAFFYLRVVAVMYFSDGKESSTLPATPMLNTGIAVMVVATIVLGLFSGPIVDLASKWSDALTVVASTTP